MRRDDGAQVAAVLDRGDRADIGDDSRKHSGLPGALVDLEPVAAKLAFVGLPPAAVRFGECAAPDIAQRGQTAPAQDRRAIEQHPLHPIVVDTRACLPPPAFPPPVFYPRSLPLVCLSFFSPPPLPPPFFR